MQRKRDILGRRLPLPILDKSAPFWRGETAEAILDQRIEQRRVEQAEKAAKRRRKRESVSPRSPSLVDVPEALRKRLRRLERNLPKRKTLAARLRNEQEIAHLRRELGLS